MRTIEVPVNGNTAVRVVFFSDMKGSTALKQEMTEKWDEDAFQRVRQQHNVLLNEIITRDQAGEIIKSTGDGFLAIFHRPSTAVERALEIQERLRGHPQIRVRIGIDMGEVRVESTNGTPQDVFGWHVDWAARVMALADGGHICVTRPIYTDAFSWITKSRIAWKEHGFYRVKPGAPPPEIFEPYNANIALPMEKLGGEEVAPAAAALSAVEKAGEGKTRHLSIIRSWEHVARDGREFADNGAGTMYWFKVPLGGLSYPEGFRNFLQPALMNPRITKIRFLLESTAPAIRRIWYETVLPLAQTWAAQENRGFQLDQRFLRVKAAEDDSLLYALNTVANQWDSLFL